MKSTSEEKFEQNEARFTKHTTRVQHLNCYEVTEDELLELEKASDVNVSLTFALASFSAFVSLAGTRATLLDSANIPYLLDIIMVASLILAVVLGIQWFVNRRGRSGLIDKIRAREQ